MAHEVSATTEDLLKHKEMHSTPGFVCSPASAGSRCVTVWSQQLPANGENPENSNSSSRSQMEYVPKSAHCVSFAPSHFHPVRILTAALQSAASSAAGRGKRNLDIILMTATMVWAASVIARHSKALPEIQKSVVSVSSQGQPWVAAGGETLSRLQPYKTSADTYLKA